MNPTAFSAPAVAGSHTAPSVSAVMGLVLLALLPGIGAYFHYFGPSILVQLLLATVVALLCEALVLAIRRVPVLPCLFDLSAVLTAWLLALSMPPMIPWWINASSTAFAILAAKHVYGGLGYNPFNPAMAGFCAAIVAFPKQMSLWPPPLEMAATRYDFVTLLGYIFPGWIGEGRRLDAETMATPLDLTKTRISSGQTWADLDGLPILGHLGGTGTEVIAACYIAGGLFLWARKIVTWHMPAAFIAGVALPALAVHAIDPTHHGSTVFHLFAGATMLGAFFIVTDPVSGATTPIGKLVFAGLAGVLTYVIREFGGYVDGVAFAVLIMNCAAPLVDAWTRPAIFGATTARAGGEAAR